MVDGVGPPLGQDVAKPLLVLHRAEQWNDRDRMRAARRLQRGQLAMDGIEREFARIDEQQHRRPKRQYLPAELGADRAAGAGHHHHLVGDVPLEQVAIGRHRIAAEQVLDLERTDVADLDAAMRQVHEPRQRANLEPLRAHHVEDLAPPVP